MSEATFKVGDKIKISIDHVYYCLKKEEYDTEILMSEDNDYFMLSIPDSSTKLIVEDLAYYKNYGHVYTYLPNIDTKSGMRCNDTHCNTFNEYALPNMPDGTYKCFSCRNRV